MSPTKIDSIDTGVTETIVQPFFYEKPIELRGIKWNDSDKEQWFRQQTIKRSYQIEVLSKLQSYSEFFDVVQYGMLTVSESYPLYSVQTKSIDWNNNNKTILVTGGVHGYETSGVQGALRFIETNCCHDSKYTNLFNFIILPCISPWSYETINRWNPKAIDPNRSFHIPNIPGNNINYIEETTFMMNYINSLKEDKNKIVDIICHIDLHETTDSDITIFGPALAMRDGVRQAFEETSIPDGFYLVGNSDRPAAEFNAAIVRGICQVTHLVPDSDNILGEPVVQRGVINAPARQLGLCMGFTGADHVTTTELYPDSVGVTAEECVLAQVAAVTSGLDYLLSTVAATQA